MRCSRLGSKLTVQEIIKDHQGKVETWAAQDKRRAAMRRTITGNLTKLDGLAKQALASLR